MKNILSIVMPVRVDSEERIANLKSVLSWTDRIGCPIILLEADKSERLRSVAEEYTNVTYIFEEDNKEVFHRTKYINRLLRSATTDVVAVWDADIIVAYQQVAKAVSFIVDSSYTMVYPYDGRYIMLPPELSDSFRAVPDIMYLDGLKLQSVFNQPFCGGVYLVDRKKYLEAGGENERFVGWGPEDAERLRRIQILELGVRWLPKGAAYHLHHTRNIQQQGLENPLLTSMRREFIKECAMDRDELNEYIKTMNKTERL